jgi:hypothetical protein
MERAGTRSAVARRGRLGQCGCPPRVSQKRVGAAEQRPWSLCRSRYVRRSSRSHTGKSVPQDGEAAPKESAARPLLNRGPPQLTDRRAASLDEPPLPPGQAPSKEGRHTGTHPAASASLPGGGRICVPWCAVRCRYTAHREAASSGRAGRTSLGERAGFHGSHVVASQMRPSRSERDSL